MTKIQDINTKELHDATGKIVRAAQRGQRFRVFLDGEHSCLLLPPGEKVDPPWEEIMAVVWAAQNKPEPARPNPILAERKKRNHAAHLR